MTDISQCTCPPCTTEDTREFDEMCWDPDCPWGKDPACPFHGDNREPVCLGGARMDDLAAAGFPAVSVAGCSSPDCPVCTTSGG